MEINLLNRVAWFDRIYSESVAGLSSTTLGRAVDSLISYAGILSIRGGIQL